MPNVKGGQQNDQALRQAAKQFEAVLLMQLTSALNSSSSDDEDLLFGSDGGSDLAKKMFSEHLATAMSEAGGVGLAETILEQFGVSSNEKLQNKNPFSNAMAAVREIRQDASPINNSQGKTSGFELINRSAKIEPVIDNFGTGDLNSAEIISVSTDTNYAQEEWRKPFSESGEINMNNPLQGISQGGIISNINPANSSSATAFQMPTIGRISSDFGSRFHPIDKRTKFHGGIDIAAPRGTEISAAADGIVKFAGRKGGYGNMVIIEHADGRQTRYAHADTLIVKKGDKVSVGQPIATVGSTGKATGPHLHFEVRENGKPVNPYNVLSNVLPNSADR